MENTDYYGDTFKWFTGVVVRVVDDIFVQVRCFGIHNQDRTKLPDTDLPLALVSMPTTGGQAGSGHFGHGLTVDSWVHGYFLDGQNCQQPIVTGVIQGTAFSMSSQSEGGGSFVNQPLGYNDGGDSSTPSNVPSTGTQDIPGGSNVEKSYNYVYDKLTREGDNDPHLHASALVGCIELESGKSINPQIVNPSSGAYGICQWLGSRKTNLFRYCGSQSSGLGQQLDFMWYELNHSERRAKSAWLSASNMPDSVAGFCKFERAEEVDRRTGQVIRSHQNYKIRLKYAYEVYNSIKATAPKDVTNPSLSTIKPGAQP